MKIKIATKILTMSRFFIYMVLVQIVFTSLSFAHNGYGQKIANSEIQCNWKNIELSEAFVLIQKEADLFFTYTYENIEGIKLSTPKQTYRVLDLLSYISEVTGLEFKIDDENVYVYPGKYNPEEPVELEVPTLKNLNKLIKPIYSEVILTPIYIRKNEDRTIRGMVADESGVPLIGANVVVKGLGQGSVTDVDGKFVLEVSDDGEVVIEVSYIGYVSQSVEIKDQVELYIVLKEDASEIEEVIIIGYGQTKAEELTTSVQRVGMDKLTKQAVTSFEQVLSGQVPGVSVSQTTGAPGGNISVRVRGIGSISNNHEPLYVIDGVALDNDLQGSTGRNAALEQNTNPLSTINPQDIESISILKDAAAAAIYGSRAANGVVLITTKSGAGKGITISYNAFTGIQSVLGKVDVLDAYEYAQLSADGQNAQYVFRNPDASINDPNGVRGNSSWQIAPELFPYLAGIQGLNNTDWQEEIFREAKIQSQNLSLSGGLSGGNFYASINHLKQEGIVIGSNFERFTARMKYNTASDKKMRFGINFSPSLTDSDLVSSEGPWWQQGVISAAQVYAPVFPVYNPDGTFNFGNNNWGYGHTNQLNPVAMALLDKDRKQQYRLLGNTYLSLEIFDDFVYKVSLGGDVNFFKRDTYSPSTLERRGQVGPSDAFGRSRSEIAVNYTLEHTLNYNRRINKHGIDGLLGFSAQKNRVERNFVRGTGYPNNLVETLNAASIIESGFSNGSEWSLLSYFGRIQYDYAAKYLLSASIRADGSSRFAPNNKWGYFPSAAVGWVISKEDFFKKIKFVDKLKLRASYGESGNFDIGNYAFIATLNNDNYVFGEGDGVIVTGLRPGNLGNDLLAWESQNMFNTGIDAELFSGKINLIFDFYRSINENFLFNVPISAASGFSSILQNQGKIENKGIEFSIGTDLSFSKDLSFSAAINVTKNSNKVLELDGNSVRLITSGSVSGATYLTEVGQPLGAYYIYKTDGVYLNQADVDNSPSHPDARPGDVKYVDINNDDFINVEDRTVVGSYFPDYTFGGNMRLEYKGLDLSATIAGSQGNEILNLHRRYTYNITGNFNQLKGAVNRWKSESDIGDGVTVSAKTSTGRQGDISDRHVEDGSFVRIQNITMGYNFSKEIISRIGLSNLRLYTSIQNPFLWTNYTGYNPEVNNRPNSATSPGEDYGSYPLAKVFSLGIDVSF